MIRTSRPKRTAALIILIAASLAMPSIASENAPQYLITIAQGVSRAEAQSLISGTSHVQATRNTRSGSQRSTLRVTSGRPARIESGRHLYAVEGIYAADVIGRNVAIPFGVQLAEKPLTRGFSVTATQRGKKIEIIIEPFLLREGRDSPENRETQELSTQLMVEPDEWTLIGGGQELPDPSSKIYGTRAETSESLTLLKVVPVISSSSQK